MTTAIPTKVKSILNHARESSRDRTYWKTKLEDTEVDLATGRTQLETQLKSQQIIQSLAAELQNQANVQISKIVTKCLRAVFPDPYEFEIIFQEKRGKTEAVMQFKRAGNIVDPMTASGGGAVDVAAFALRIAAVVLALPRSRRLLLLDEPFRFVSVNLRENVRLLLDVLAEELDFQIVLVSHMPELAGLNSVVI